MGSILALISVLCLLVGIVTLIKPIPAIKIATRKQAMAVLAGGFVIASIGSATDPNKKVSSNSATANAAQNETLSAPVSPTTADTPKIQVALRASVPIPIDEQNFIAAVEEARNAFGSAPNEMAQGGIRAQRRTTVCQILPGFAVTNWVGKIAALSSNNQGKGVLAISIAKDIRLRTADNSLSDMGSNTLIEPGSALFATASSLKKGDMVAVSGHFFRDDTDCIMEDSMGLHGSMTDPEYRFRFTALSKI